MERRPRGPQLQLDQDLGRNMHPGNLQHAAGNSALIAETQRRLQTRRHGYAAGSETDTEAALVDRAQSGDRDAFSNLVSGQCKTLYRLVLRITKNHEDAEDVVQEAILKAHSKLSQFAGRARFSTWMGRIAINEALMKLRRNKRKRQVPLDVPAQAERWMVPFPKLERGGDPETLYARMEVRQLTLQAVRSLLPKYQAVFLARVTGCTNRETADALGLSVAAVRARLRRAGKQMRKKLTPICESCPVEERRTKTGTCE